MRKFEIREQGYTFTVVEAADAEQALDIAVANYCYHPSDYNAEPGQSVEVEWYAWSVDEDTSAFRVITFTAPD